MNLEFGQNFTIEQIRTLDAIARLGSIARASEELNKVHSAVVYTMKSLEDLAAIPIFDRSGYRTRLTHQGERFWHESRKVLLAEELLRRVLSTLKTGWEPRLKVIFDGIIPFDFLLPGFKKLQALKTPTKISYFTEYLAKVESRFQEEMGDIMLSVIPPVESSLHVEQLQKLKLLLVVSKKHPLAKGKARWRRRDLSLHTMVNVRGGDFRLQLATKELDGASQFHVPDFISKKAVLMAGLGYGWMPEYLIHNELVQGQLRKLRWEETSESQISIYLATRGSDTLGRAAQVLVETFKLAP